MHVVCVIFTQFPSENGQLLFMLDLSNHIVCLNGPFVFSFFTIDFKLTFRSIKTMPANQNPHDFNELKY